MDQGATTRPVYYPGLDGLRGVAALMVVYGHAGYFGWVPLVAGCATIGVLLFFFLSGFLMGHHYMPAARAGVFDTKNLSYWARFLLRRIVRIYPPYLFAPILGYLLLRPAMPPDFSQSKVFGEFSVVEELWNIAAFRGELGIYWTIKVELFFYLIYPIIIGVCSIRRNRAGSLVLILAALVFLHHFPSGIAGASWRLPVNSDWMGFVAIFVAGVLTAETMRKYPDFLARRPKLSGVLAFASFLGLALTVALISRSEPTQDSIWAVEWWFALLFFVMFVSLIRAGGPINRLLSSRSSVMIGRASYSLYLIHIIAFYASLKHFGHEFQGIATTIAVLALLTTLYYLVVERRFIRLSKTITVEKGTG
jgi:peptidoglycan/LPS O-acetylase OafA/YrhL